MVDVNGGMVPPKGDDKSQAETITYWEIDKDNKETGTHSTVDKGSSLGSGDTVSKVHPDSKSKAKGVDGTRRGKNPSISVMSDECWILILMHVHLQSKSGCTAQQMANAKKKLETAASKWNETETVLPCKSGKGTGCTVTLRLVWHNESSPKVINVRVDCSKKEPKGSTQSGGDKNGNDAYIEVAPPDDKESDGSEGYYAHELGHNLFGTQSAENLPKEWKGAHNPDDKGLMRDTDKTKPIDKKETPSIPEKQLLYKLYGLVCDGEKCCNEDKKTHMIINRGISHTGSDDRSASIQGGTVTQMPNSSRLDGLVFITSNTLD